MSNNKSEYVYFIKNTLTNNIKIGVAGNIESRLKTLQTANCSPLEVIHTIKFKQRKAAEAKEKYLHSKFKRYRMLGEWFDADAVKILENSVFKHPLAEFINICAKCGDDVDAGLTQCAICSVPDMTAPQYAKHLGAPSLSHVSRVSGVALQTLYDWHKTKPDLFRCVVLGVIQES